jgi:beta-glucosidase
MKTISHEVEEKVEKLLKQLSLSEKVSLLSGRDLWRTVAIPRLGIPALVMTDGPHGVRSDGAAERIPGPATSFPTGVSFASSWDPALIERVGKALGEETRGMGCDILLGPCVNIVRTPLAGRNFEAYSEDPYLAGRTAVAFIKGVQSKGVGTSLKHYALNNQEIERGRGSSVVDERSMREIYLTQFEMAVKEAQPWTVMCSYNRINGIYASENYYLLTEILRDEWGFEGLVVSDWGANHTTVESVEAGMDLEMPGPTKWYGRLLEEAAHNWQIDEEVIDDNVRRILRLIYRSGRMGDPAAIPPGAANTPEHLVLAREVQEQSMVLLKNEGGLLPFDASQINTLAVIGPNAAECRFGGGGSSYLIPPYAVSPLEGLRNKLGGSVKVHYASGCSNLVEPGIMGNEFFRQPDGKQKGLAAEYFPTSDFSGTSIKRVDDTLNMTWFGSGPEKSISTHDFSVRWTGKLVSPESGKFTITIGCLGAIKLWLDGKLVFDNNPGPLPLWVLWSDPKRVMQTRELDLVAGNVHDLKIEYVKTPSPEGPSSFGGEEVAGVRLVYLPPENPASIQEAAELAAECDAVVLCIGFPTGYESEGGDRPDMELTGRQNELVKAVVKANPKTVVVLNAGSPVALPWVKEVKALIEAFYMGQEGGNALANVLFGDVNPSGKLSETFPVRLQDNPAYINYPGTMEVLYGEGIFVGYRYYDMKDVEPLFPFGFGLSYTTFGYSTLSAPANADSGKPFKVSVRVKNTGKRAGREIVQLYVHDVKSSLVRPPKELKGFQKVELQPGEAKTVEFTLDFRSFAFYDPYKREWVAEPGEFEILVGASSRDIRAKARLTLK